MTNENKNATQAQTGQADAAASSQQAQMAQQPLKAAPLNLIDEGGNGIFLTTSWPLLTEIMEGVIDGKLVKKVTDDIVVVTVANGQAEYQIVNTGADGLLTMKLLPGFTFTPIEADTAQAETAEQPVRTVDDRGRHIG